MGSGEFFSQIGAIHVESPSSAIKTYRVVFYGLDAGPAIQMDNQNTLSLATPQEVAQFLTGLLFPHNVRWVRRLASNLRLERFDSRFIESLPPGEDTILLLPVRIGLFGFMSKLKELVENPLRV